MKMVRKAERNEMKQDWKGSRKGKDDSWRREDRDDRGPSRYDRRYRDH
jgi:hypothetical protein